MRAASDSIGDLWQLSQCAPEFMSGFLLGALAGTVTSMVCIAIAMWIASRQRW